MEPIEVGVARGYRRPSRAQLRRHNRGRRCLHQLGNAEYCLEPILREETSYVAVFHLAYFNEGGANCRLRYPGQ